MKHLIIVGAGGMGRSMYLHAQNCIGYGTIFDVKGFLEIDKNMLDNFEGYPPIIGDENTYHICKDDVFICSFGDVKLRIKSEIWKSWAKILIGRRVRQYPQKV